MAQPSNRSSSGNSSALPFGPGTLVLGAGTLMVYGLSRRSKPGTLLAAAGGLLAYGAVKAGTRSKEAARAVFLVNATPQEAYALWRNFENLPRFMAHLKQVRVLQGDRSEWVANGPMGSEIRWTAEITADVPGERIAWRSLPDADVSTEGSVEFRAHPQGRGTFVTAEVNYVPPAGKMGTAAAALAGKHPEFMVREGLRRFKALLETGETPTIAGQTHGPRGIHGRTERVLFRETSNMPEPQVQSGQGTRALARTA